MRENFEASEGWLKNFLKRYDLCSKVMHGESESAKKDLIEKSRHNPKIILSQYHPDGVYNADEAGLFFRLGPSRTICSRSESFKGTKKDKARITLLFASNISGTRKIKPFLIHTSAVPRCLKYVDFSTLPIDDDWSLIDEGTIRRCWRHSGILPNQFLKDLNIEPEMKNSKNDEFILLLKKLNEINENFDMTVEEYIDSDLSCQTFEIPNDSEILEEVLVNANLKTSNVEENSETEEDLDPEPKYITLKKGEEAMNKCISYFEQFNYVQSSQIKQIREFFKSCEL
ncbi:unnamed protein product [Brachionus calyciflorus]|uniref:HTH CENPB-type domain-containing protein n=1 Tax=Brachionus calyciflorus TaxID=104777 RepID=A0A814K7S8_9BILA|nr:unnamed protein product [Brachionus calyciflorus]